MDLESRLAFICEAGHLKDVLRTAWTPAGRQESTAEHSWRLALLAWVIAEDRPELDLARVLLLCLVHDLGEIDTGDISAALQPDKDEKFHEEEAAVQRLSAGLEEPLRIRLMAAWQEYNAGATPEARLVKALDKAETLLTHNQGQNDPIIDYDFNLGYGTEWFQHDETLRAMRLLLDAGTREKKKPDAEKT